jgi:hypothetical protein
VRGRKPNPNAIRRRDATMTPVDLAPAADPGALKKPQSVCEHAGMSSLWDTVVGTGKMFRSEDGPFIEQLVFLLETARQCRMNCLDDNGNALPVVGKGEPREDGTYLSYAENPWMKSLRDTEAQALKLAETLGLTPMARTRLGLSAATGKAMLSIADQIDAAMRRDQK